MDMIIDVVSLNLQDFRGGTIWSVIVSIHNAIQAIGLGLLVIFFLIGVLKTCFSWEEVKRPEVAITLFIRFAVARALVVYGMDLMLSLFGFGLGVINQIVVAAMGAGADGATMPEAIRTTIESLGFFRGIWVGILALLGTLGIIALSYVMLLSAYQRFFKLYIYVAVSPIPLSSFAGQPTSTIGTSFLKSFGAVCLEGAIIVLAMVIFNAFASSPPLINLDASPTVQVMTYLGETLFTMLVLVGLVRMADRVVREMLGLYT